MQAARGRGAAAVAAAVLGTLRASTSTRTTRFFHPAASPGPPAFLYLDSPPPPFLQPGGRGCDNEGKRGAWGGPSLGLFGPPLQVVGAHLKLAEPGGQTTRSTSLFLVGRSTRIFLGFIVEIC